MTPLARNIHTAIARRGLTVTAAAVECGIDRVTMYRYLADQRTPPMSRLETIAAALGTTVSKLTKGM